LHPIALYEQIKNMIRFCQIKPDTNLESLSDDLRHIASEHWNPHLNVMQYQGDWNILSIIAPGGKNIAVPDALGGEDFMATPLLDLVPNIKSVLDYFKCPLRSVRLMKLKAGAKILKHRDAELSYEHGEARLHIPLQTNEEVRFILDDELLPMRTGECWYINANLYHSVENNGSTDRIHLVIDCEVNEWLSNLFSEAIFISERTEALDQNLQKAIIESLYLQGSETSIIMAKKMEEDLIRQFPL